MVKFQRQVFCLAVFVSPGLSQNAPRFCARWRLFAPGLPQQMVAALCLNRRRITFEADRCEEQGAVDAAPNAANSVGVGGVRLGKRGALVPFRPERVHRNRGGNAVLS